MNAKLIIFVGVLLLFAGCLSQTEDKRAVLVIGSPSQETLKILKENTDVTIKSAAELENKPGEQLREDDAKGRQYKIVFLDQSNQQDKSISASLATAFDDWVRSGGKLVIVKDSGIYTPGSLEPNGWENLKRISPMGCKRLIEGKPSCTYPATVKAKIVSQKRDHAIMKGVDMFPTKTEDRLTLTTFPIERIGTELAYIEADTGETYTAIVESKLIIGKVLYFNYDPGMTPQILKQTILYLR